METLGINVISFLAQLINFTILFFVLRKLVFRTVIDLIAKQRKQAKDTEKFQQEIAAERENIIKLKTKELAKARKEAETFVAKTKADMEKQKKTVLAEAEKKALRTVSEAQVEAKAMETQLVRKVEDYGANLAVAIASKLIGENLRENKQQALIKKAITELKKAEV